jgi:hypothetical protein
MFIWFILNNSLNLSNSIQKDDKQKTDNTVSGYVEKVVIVLHGIFKFNLDLSIPTTKASFSVLDIFWTITNLISYLGTWIFGQVCGGLLDSIRFSSVRLEQGTTKKLVL